MAYSSNKEASQTTITTNLQKWRKMKKAVLLSVILLTTSFSKDIVKLGIEAYDQGNYYKAAEIFSMACDDGNAECCNMLGALYSDGLGVKVDYHKAA